MSYGVDAGRASHRTGAVSATLDAFLHNRLVITHIRQIAGYITEFATDAQGHLVLLDAVCRVL